MKTILVTGVTGFLGSHLVHNLKDSYRLVLLKRHSSDLWRLKDIAKDLNFYDIDSVNIDLESIFRENNIDIIIHTATNYGRQKSNLKELLEANIFLPLQLVECGIKYNTQIFINTDTYFNKRKLYGSYLKEYILSKKQLLEWLKLYSEKIKVINLKLEHIYGPKDSKSKFVTNIIAEMFKNKLEIDLTEGLQKRDFVYIDDVVNVYRLLLDKIDLINHSFFELEVGTGKTISIKELVSVIKNITKSSSKLNFGTIPYRENEIFESVANINNMKDFLGWVPNIDINQGLEIMIESERGKNG